MAGREPFTDRLSASEDPSCSPPNAFGGETQGPVFRPTSGTRFSSSQGETERVFPRRGPQVILWRETEKVFRRRDSAIPPSVDTALVPGFRGVAQH